jgi:hypothetical protein
MHANLDGGRNSETKALLMNRKVGTLVLRKFFSFILAFDDFVLIRYDHFPLPRAGCFPRDFVGRNLADY